MPAKLTKASLLAFMKPRRSYNATQLAQHFSDPTDRVRQLLVELTAEGLIESTRRSWQTLYMAVMVEADPVSRAPGIPDIPAAATEDSASEPPRPGALLSGYDARLAAQRQLALLARGPRA